MGIGKRSLVIYHAACRDGWCAAWVAHKSILERGDGEPELYAAYHGTAPPDVTDRNVLILDFCYPRPVLEEMRRKARILAVLDHHKTAAEDLRDFPGATFDMNRSGAGLTWDLLFQGQPRPWFVDYVEDRDLWRKALPDTDAINAFISTLPFTIAAWDTAAKLDAALAIPTGKAVLAKTEQYVLEVAKNATRFFFEGHNVPLVNAPQVDISELLSHLAQGEPFAMGWWQRGDGRFQYSLRSRGENPIDVSVFAKRYGGGGHAQAAGFETDRLLHVKAIGAGRLGDD